MTQQLRLLDLRPGGFGRVTRLNATAPLYRRLLDIGLIEGTRVECVLARRRGPAAYLIRGALIALRADDAAAIFIEMA